MNAQPTLLDHPSWMNKWNYQQELRDKPCSSDESRLADFTRLPVWVFVSSNGARVLSRVPVEVAVINESVDDESAESAFVFACKKLHVFASAATYKEAEDQFHDQVVHFFYSYRNVPRDQITDDAAEIQALYQTYFQESAPPVR